MSDYPTTAVPFPEMLLRELRDPVLSGPGAASLGSAAESYRQLGDLLKIASEDLRVAMRRAREGHEGAAAELAEQHVNRIVAVGELGAGQAQITSGALYDGAGYYTRIRDDMAALPPIEESDDIRAANRVQRDIDANKVIAVEAAERYERNANWALGRQFQVYEAPVVEPPGPRGAVGGGGTGVVAAGFGTAGFGANGGTVLADSGAGGVGVGGGSAGGGFGGAAAGNGPGGSGGVPGGPGAVPAPVVGGTAVGGPGAGGSGSNGSGSAVGSGAAGSASPGRGGSGPGGGPGFEASGSPGAGGPGATGPGAGSGAGGPGAGGSGGAGQGVPVAGGTGSGAGGAGRGRPRAVLPATLRPASEDPDAGRYPNPDGRGGTGSTGNTRGDPAAPPSSGWQPGQPWSSRTPADAGTGAYGGSGPLGGRAVDDPYAAPGNRPPGPTGSPSAGSAPAGGPIRGTPGSGVPFFPGAAGAGRGEDSTHTRPSWLLEDDPQAFWLGNLPPHGPAVIGGTEDRP